MDETNDLFVIKWSHSHRKIHQSLNLRMNNRLLKGNVNVALVCEPPIYIHQWVNRKIYGNEARDSLSSFAGIDFALQIYES